MIRRSPLPCGDALATLAPSAARRPIQTLLVPDDHHRALLLKGRILSKADWPVVAGARVDELHVVRMESGDVHEDEAARRLAKVVAGSGVIVHGPVESQVRLSAEVNGI